jgi:hypothetical protein
LNQTQAHWTDAYAHQAQFDLKENVQNKSVSFNSEQDCDHTKYPSTRAVVEFVASKLSEFETTLPNVENWVDDIIVVNNREELPEASAKYHRRAYFLRVGAGSYAEVAICRLADNGEYYWDISELGGYTKFNPDQFYNSADGLSLNTAQIVRDILSEEGVLQNTLDTEMAKFYTSEQIDAFHYVNSIKLLPGTMDGTIRFYVNDDPSTMSDDIKVAGLKRLAYLDYVTENEIYDQAVQERHIINRAIATRHIQDRAVDNEKIRCPMGFIIGNVDDESETAQYIPLQTVKQMVEDDMDELSEEEIEDMWDDEFEDPDETSCDECDDYTPMRRVTTKAIWDGNEELTPEDSTQEAMTEDEVEAIWDGTMSSSEDEESCECGNMREISDEEIKEILDS